MLHASSGRVGLAGGLCLAVRGCVPLQKYDATELVKAYKGPDLHILVDQVPSSGALVLQGSCVCVRVCVRVRVRVCACVCGCASVHCPCVLYRRPRPLPVPPGFVASSSPFPSWALFLAGYCRFVLHGRATPTRKLFGECVSSPLPTLHTNHNICQAHIKRIPTTHTLRSHNISSAAVAIGEENVMPLFPPSCVVPRSPLLCRRLPALRRVFMPTCTCRRVMTTGARCVVCCTACVPLSFPFVHTALPVVRLCYQLLLHLHPD